MNSFWKFLRGIIKSEFNEIDYWNRARTIKTMYKKINLCAIRFNLRIEIFTIQILLYNQTLINLEQCTKLLDNFRSYLYEINNMLSNENTIHVKLKNRIDFEINWSKQIIWNLIQWIRLSFNEKQLRSTLTIILTIIELNKRWLQMCLLKFLESKPDSSTPM